MHTLQDLNIVAHHTLQDIIKIIMPDGAPHVISRSSWSAMFTYGSFLHSPCTFINEAISPWRFSFDLWLWYVFATLYRQCFYKTSRSRFLSGGSRIFLLGVLRGGLTVQRVLKKRIKLIISNDRLTLAISFLIQQLWKKAYLTFFLWY